MSAGLPLGAAISSGHRERSPEVGDTREDDDREIGVRRGAPQP